MFDRKALPSHKGDMDKLILVGAVGAVARYLTGLAALRSLGAAWPFGTLAVNVVGGFAMGLLAALLAARGEADQDRWRLLLGVGVLGGFTTFSAFSLEVAMMIMSASVPIRTDMASMSRADTSFSKVHALKDIRRSARKHWCSQANA